MALDFVAGLLGGAAGVLIGHPFDTIKVRLQTQAGGSAAKYKSTFHCFRCILKEESIVGLYKGISSPLAGLAFINAIVFGAYGNSLKSFGDQSDNIRSHFVAGSVAGLAQTIICSPMELSKLRMQLQGQGVRPLHIFFWADPPLSYKGPTDCLRQTFNKSGFRGVFRGLPGTVLRDCPCFGVYFASYEWMTHRMSGGHPEQLTSAKLLCAGGLAGMISWLALYPIDVLKSRFQADEHNKYKSMWHCAVHSYRQEGWRVFMQGLTPTLLRAFPTNAVTFFTVEWVFRMYNSYSSSSTKSAPLTEKVEEGLSVVLGNSNSNSSSSSSSWYHAGQSIFNNNWLYVPLPEAGATLLEPLL